MLLNPLFHIFPQTDPIVPKFSKGEEFPAFLGEETPDDIPMFPPGSTGSAVIAAPISVVFMEQSEPPEDLPPYRTFNDGDINLQDVTINNASTSRHGFTPKGDGSPSHYLGGDLQWHEVPVETIYYWANTADALGGLYKVMDTTQAGVASNTYTVSGVDQEKQDWITPISGVGFTTISSGSIVFHFHAQRTSGTATAFAYCKLYSRTNPGGVETLLGTSGNSAEVTDVNDEHEVSFELENPATLNLTDRLVVKLFMSRTGGGSDPDIVIYLGGDSDSHIHLPANFFDASSTPTFAGLTLSNLTASRLVVSDAAKKLISNGALTTNKLPKAISSGASLADSCLTDDGTTLISSQNILVGAKTSSGTTTPKQCNLGGTYNNTTNADPASLKFVFYDDNSNRDGISLSSVGGGYTQMEYLSHSGVDHAWYIGTTPVEKMRLSASTGSLKIASLAGTGTRTVVADANGVLSAP